MNLLRKNFITPTRLLFTTLLFQVLLIPNTYAIDVSINGSENLTLMNSIIFDYESTPNIIEFDIANPFVCTNSFPDVDATTILKVDPFLDGNQVLSAAFDYSSNVFKVNTDGDIQCASELGIYNDVIFKQAFESSGNNIEIVLKDLETGAILDSASDLELYNGQAYQYKYEIRNTSPSNINIDVSENYLKMAAPTFVRDDIDGWVCSVISGNGFSTCGSSSSDIGYVSLQNAVISPFGQIDVVVTRRVSVGAVGSLHKLDLLAAVFLNNGVYDSNQFNNITFTSFGTRAITATQLDVTTTSSNTVSGDIISPIVVEMLDADGILDVENTSLVTISINQSSPPGGTLSGNTSVSAVNGVATFSGLSIDKSGENYILRVSSNGLAADNTNAFNIIPGAATHLFIAEQPSDTVAQTTMSLVVVHALDDNNNIDTSYNGRVFANIKSGNGNLSGTTNPFANSGVAEFDNLSIDASGTGYTMQFSSGSLQGVISNLFDITPVPSAANSVFAVFEDSQEAGSFVNYNAVIRDAFGDRVGEGVEVDFEIETTFGDALILDFTCTTEANGECLILKTSLLVGTTKVKAYVSGVLIESIRFPYFDTTTWTPGAPDAQMSNFGAANATANINSSVVLEAELKDINGNLVPSESVTFQLVDSLGSTPPSSVCSTLTDMDGVCTSSITSSETGTTTIKAFFGFPSTEITNTNNYNGQGKVITWQ